MWGIDAMVACDAESEMVVDTFAGGGGASKGIAAALGRPPDVAINHDPGAIEMHSANHPETVHYTESVWKTSPRKITRGRPVGLLWASPDCAHFSRAKGAKPVKKQIRSLAWVVVRWAGQSRPRVIILENVREFEDWGPLVPRWACRSCDWRGTEGQAALARFGRRACPRCDSRRLAVTEDMVPDPSRKGLTFKRFVGRLRALGYAVEWKVLNAADYGAPTHRRRLFLIARSDGAPIAWPEPTHGDPTKLDADLFTLARKPWRTAAECIDWSPPCPSIFERKRPLAEATMRRIALGIKRYVLDNARPFLVTCNHGGPEFRGQALGRPLPTLTAARDAHGLIAPTLIQVGYGERDGQSPRVLDLNKPMGVVVSSNKQALVAPLLAPMTHDNRAVPVTGPLPTVTTQTNRAPLVAAFLAKHYGRSVGQDPGQPAATVTARSHDGLVAANLIHLNRNTGPSGCDEPMRTVTGGGNHAALVYSFMVKYFGTSVGQAVDEPMHTATGKDRFGLVTVNVNGETYVITDIGMRMLRPRELARGQGFPDDYVLTGTATSQVAKIGNSVPPALAKALVGANYAPPRVVQVYGLEASP
jgi:DNA (cytosine-5)-methyltransferase 1